VVTLTDLSPELRSRLRAVRLISLDVDGVLTDGRIVYTETTRRLGSEDENEVERVHSTTMSFHVHDGQGIKDTLNAGLEVAIVTGRQSSTVKRRADELGIKYVFQRVENKPQTVRELIDNLNLQLHEVAHVGDDLNDLPLFKEVGVSVAVPNAVSKVRDVADIVLNTPGGQGAVREFCDLLLDARGY